MRYVAAKPLPGDHLKQNTTEDDLARARIQGFKVYVEDLDERDTIQTWSDHKYIVRRMAELANFTAAHRERRTWKRPSRG